MEFLLRAGGRQRFIFARDKNKKDQKNLRNRAITSNEPLNTEINRVDQNAPITSKQVFLKRSVKMIDGTEKPKIFSKFAKHAAQSNEFDCKSFKVDTRMY